MRFKELKLLSNNLAGEKSFYADKLGCPLVHHSANSFAVKVGWSQLTFERSDSTHFYHYCFLIPGNKLHEALRWMQQRVDIINPDGNGHIQHFESWNADSFYFYDASGNIAECIARYDLQNTSSVDFDFESILGLNEIGLPTADIEATDNILATKMSSEFWKGDFSYFGTHGTQEGLILLPNMTRKNTWFPTELRISPEPFDLVLEHLHRQYFLHFDSENLSIKTLTPN